MNLRKIPLWLWPNTLSLDAPLVAAAWVWMFKEALGVRFYETSAVWILMGAIWSVYVLDRIVDAYKNRELTESSYRHAFSWKFRWPLLATVLAVAGYSIYFTLYHLPAAMFSAGVAVIFLVILYFGALLLSGCKNQFVRFIPQVIFALMAGLFLVDTVYVGFVILMGKAVGTIVTGALGLIMAALIIRLCFYFKSDSIPYGKNLAAGFIFAIGVAIPASLYQSNPAALLVDVFFPLVDSEKGIFWRFFDTFYNSAVAIGNHLIRVVGTVETVCFGLLCMFNITAIDLWKDSRRSDNEEVKAGNEMILTMGLMGLVLFSMGYIFFAQYPAKPYFYSIMAACAILHMINRTRSKFTLDAQRVLADIALVIPVPIYFLINSSS